MKDTYRALLSILVTALMVAGGLLAASATSTVEEGTAAPRAWAPKDSDWTQFRHDAARSGLTSANASMRFAYYKWATRTGGMVYSSPAVGSLRATGNGTDVVVGSSDGRLYCINGMNGNIRWRFQAGGEIQSSPAIADINGDGRPEVMFGCNDGRIYAVNGEDGTLLWRYTTRASVVGSPLVADIDGDGGLEIVSGSADGRVYAIDGAGSKIWTLDLTPGFDIDATLAAGDINGDGRMEVVIPADDRTLYAISGASGAQLWNYSGGTSVNNGNTVAIADVDRDGSVEIFVANSLNGTSILLDGRTGHEKWIAVIQSIGYTSPAVGDCDGDGYLELFFGTNSGKILALDGKTGALDWQRQFPSYFVSSPALADMDGDGRLELIIGGMDQVVRALNAEDGTPSWAYPCPKAIRSSPAIADIDNDRRAEVVVGCDDGRIYAVDYNF